MTFPEKNAVFHDFSISVRNLKIPYTGMAMWPWQFKETFVPHAKESPYEIWVHLAQWFHRRLNDEWMDTSDIGILLAHLGTFSSGELKKSKKEMVSSGTSQLTKKNFTWVHSLIKQLSIMHNLNGSSNGAFNKLVFQRQKWILITPTIWGCLFWSCLHTKLI